MIIALSGTGKEVIPQGNLRKSILFINTDATINMFLKKTVPGVSVATSSDYDALLQPGGNFSLNTQEDGEEAVQEAWSAVAASGTPNLVVFETKDRKYI